MVDHQF